LDYTCCFGHIKETDRRVANLDLNQVCISHLKSWYKRARRQQRNNNLILRHKQSAWTSPFVFPQTLSWYQSRTGRISTARSKEGKKSRSECQPTGIKITYGTGTSERTDAGTNEARYGRKTRPELGFSSSFFLLNLFKKFFRLNFTKIFRIVNFLYYF
jgi:hypothetical protein